MRARKSHTSSLDGVGSPSLTRGLMLGGFLTLWALLLVGRLYQLQIIDYVDLLSRARREQQRTIEIAPQRGTIYDRRMNPLAMSLPVDSVYAVPSEIPNQQLAAKLLAQALNLDAADLLGRFKAFRSFCWVKRKVSDGESARVHDLNLKGIYYQKEMKRFYPKGTLAAHVLGYVGLDDEGLAGIEYGLNSEIEGRPGKVLVAEDAHRQSFHSSDWKGVPGKNVVLTLDENIQYVAEKVLGETVRHWHAAGGTVIVEDPNSGEILALANQPTFNPNEYSESRPNALMNRAVGWIYEPGSTFKVITISGALEDGLARPQEFIDCQFGSILLGGRTIHDDIGAIRHEQAGPLTLSQVLAYSSDVGAVKMALRLGEDRFYQEILKFGFGAKTNVGLPGEEKGLLMPPQDWSGVSIGEIAIGQGIGITPIQLANAYSTVANGGVEFEPRVVREVVEGDKRQATPPTFGRRVISEQTAAEMKEMLEGVVEHGTGVAAQLNGYSAAGKTGTAQKVDASGRYSHSHYVASFIGFAPVEKPAVTILVVIDTPVGAIYGAEVAAPAFKSIAEQTLEYLKVPQDNPSRWLQVASSTPVAPPRQKRWGAAGSRHSDSEPSGAAASQIELAAFQSTAHESTQGTVLLNDEPLTSMPDFSGLAARQVAEQCEKLGLGLNLTGTGLAIKQTPAAGSQVASGTTVWVRLGR